MTKENDYKFYVKDISTKEILFFKSTENMNFYLKKNNSSAQISEKEGKYYWLNNRYFLTHGE